MQDPQLKQQSLAQHQPFDHSTMFPYNSRNGVPYQNSPYDFDSHSLQYSSDRMDTDGSSISQGSIHSSTSSIGHLDIMLDEDANSMRSISRKPSLLSNYSSYGSENQQPEKLCPLILGQVDKCAPEICGASAPCLQFVNDEVVVPPIEECVPDATRSSPSSSFNQDQNQPTDFTPHNSPQRQRREQAEAANHSVNPAQTLQNPPMEEEKKVRVTRTRRTAKSATTDEVPLSKQTKKTRARQAHSLVERKYRENLNAKIQELHQTLQKTHFGKPCSHIASSRGNMNSIEDDDDDADDIDGRSSKVKKSDVLIEAMNYVHSVEVELRRKDEEISQLHDRIKMMENWMRTGSIGQTSMM